MKKPQRRKFYVYEHWRPDKNEPFWVGKGNGKRSDTLERNRYYNNIVAKLARLGMCVEIRMVENGLPEREAFALETIRIQFWRSRGIKLANLTDGGEGASGVVRSPETRAKIGIAARNRTPETRAKLRAGRLGKAQSVEARSKMSIAHKGKIISLETRAKMSESHKGKVFSPETRVKLSAASRGRIKSPEELEKIGAAQRGKTISPENKAKVAAASRLMWEKRNWIGFPHTTEHRAKISASLRQYWQTRPPKVFSPEYRAKISAGKRRAWALWREKQGMK